MIDFECERVISINEAAKMLPSFRSGKRMNIATVFRWALRGLKGIRLETIQIGGRKCTSVEALQRFFERLTEQAQGETGDHEARARIEHAMTALGVSGRSERARAAAVRRALEREGL